MTPLIIIATIKAGFEFGTELLKFAQTSQGMRLIDQSLEDRKKWDSFWSQIGQGLKDFFTGKTLGIAPVVQQMPPAKS